MLACLAVLQNALSISFCVLFLLLVVFLFVNVFTFVSFDALFCYLIGLCILYFCFAVYALVLLDLTFAFLSFLSITFLSVSFVIHFLVVFFHSKYFMVACGEDLLYTLPSIFHCCLFINFWQSLVFVFHCKIIFL